MYIVGVAIDVREFMHYQSMKLWYNKIHIIAGLMAAPGLTLSSTARALEHLKKAAGSF